MWHPCCASEFHHDAFSKNRLNLPVMDLRRSGGWVREVTGGTRRERIDKPENAPPPRVALTNHRIVTGSRSSCSSD